jgi:hypothetical protein
MFKTAWLLIPVLAATVAFADVPPANSTGCSNKKAGEACQTDEKKAGGCKASTCSRNDYSQGVPPKSVDYECLVCDVAAKPAACTAAPVGPLALAALGWLTRRRLAVRRR